MENNRSWNEVPEEGKHKITESIGRRGVKNTDYNFVSKW